MNIRSYLLGTGYRVWLLVIATAVVPIVAHAEEEKRAREEITVTARKVEESLQEAPLSATAFTGEMLNDKGIDNLSDIARYTPSFSFESFNGGFPQPTVRGQSQSSLINPVQNVSSFYNGIYLPRQYMIDATLLNIGQVEVLRGPQSAALGRNAFAGAINFITRKPGEELEFDATVAYGEDEYEKYQFGISGPILPGTLSGIAGVAHEEYDGGWENNHALANDPNARTKGNLGGYENDSFMGGLEFTPTDQLTITANYTKADRDIDSPGQYSIGEGGFLAGYFPINELNCGATAGNGLTLFCGELPLAPPGAPGDTRKSGLVIDPRAGVTVDTEIISAGVEYAFSEAVSLNYLYGHIDSSFDGAGAAVRDQEAGFMGTIVLDTTGNGNIKADSHELRLTYEGDALTAFGGVYYSDSDDVSITALPQYPAQTVGPLVLTPTFPFGMAEALDARKNKSVFGLVEYRTGQFTWSLEGRYTREEISVVTNNFGASSETFSIFTPRATVTYAVTDVNRVYFSYSKGAKAGGFNVRAADPSQLTFDEETNNTYEIGSRNELLDGALILNGTLFYIDAEDLQVLEPGIGSPFTQLGNRSSGETKGFELEANWLTTDNLTLYTGIGYADAEFGDEVIDPSYTAVCDDVVCSTTGAVGGNQLPRSPKWTANAGFSYENSLSSSLDFFSNANVGYQDKQYATPLNVTEIPSRTLVDATIGLRVDNGLEFKLSAKNLFDEKYVSSSSRLSFNAYLPNLGDRRLIKASVSYKFGGGR